ncbi:GNAT family N-acetyltransferase [Flagellimonas aequoris]|uniref:GNAT family N-acetyltransferase n=1 Tax=Flagellimonas aequoris TaxID=2306997 RepID=A0A418NDJ5_9FLAO|nr:GNAT family N-acetyltransferase [Allomuricauda aequoris]RIV74406.1 GNAT family N-acetyltransferase [Allomuricauda aequoris]TXK08528.1 GNAT family N-acetyltransferase [Allomuricauda aequoris]
MSDLPGPYRDHCLFQLYLEHKVHEIYQGKVINKLLDHTLDVNLDNIVDHRKFKIIKDVPDYLRFERNIPQNSKLLRIAQYNGYLINLKGYKKIEDFLNSQLSKRNTKNLHSKKRKLELQGSIEYKVLTGPIEESIYSNIFDDFKRLLLTRFDEKKIFNRDLFHWQELYAHTYPKLVQEKAMLFVIFKDNEPICIALNYILGNSMFSHIQTYHVGYSQYNMGDINMLFQLEWCLINNIDIFDVSKGRNPYKEKWCNHTYRLFYEIVYPKGSFLMALKAKNIGYRLSLMQKLRDIGLLGNIVNVDKWLYFKNKGRLKAITK